MGTVAGSGGSYSITGSHTYATNGSFTITTFVNDDGPDAASDGAQTQAVIGFGGNVVLNAATETIAVPAGTEVATFGDSNTSDTAADFIATIDWGDGTTTAGAVAGSNGSFTVASTADHTYADEGNFNEVVTITRTTDDATTAPSGTVMVADDDSLTAAGTTVSGSPGVAINATVATFSDTDTQSGAGDFVASIDWGDGSVSTGTVSGSSGSFTVSGSHTYAQNGQDTIVVSVSEEPDNPQATAFTDAQSTALIGLAPVSGSSITIAEGNAVAAGTQVATFSDSNLGDTAASFTASIDWGDGTTSAGTVAGSNGSFTVTSSGSHSYTGDFGDEGQNTVTTTLTRTDSTTATAVGAVNITESDSFAVTADNISANAGQALNNVQVATFTDTYTGNTASGFTATIDWGDGTSTLGTISGSGGSFTVDGSHTYTTGGNDMLSVTVADNEPGTATATGTASASINLGGQMVFTSATEGTAGPATPPIATFSDSTLTDTASSFTASIDWGDGVSTECSVGGGGGLFTVVGGQSYTDEGSDVVAATITRTADQASSTTSGPVSVAEGDSFAGQGTTIAANLDETFTATVATFTDPDTVTSASDLTATVNWGDGTTTDGTVSGSNGSFTVSGSHAYTAGGQDTVTVSLLDDTPGTASGTATSTATVTALSGQMALAAATEGTTLPNSTAVATFSDSNGTDTAGSFTATIDWGDGVTTAGTVVGSAGSFTVEGGHTYADEGSDPAAVTLTRTADQLQATATGNIAVAEGDNFTPQGTSFTVDVNQAFSGTVATFTDTDTANGASDFAATVDWGDGTTTTGTVSGSNGAFTVSGSHTYTAGGQDTVQVTLADDAPGTATATATTTATVRSLSGQMVLNAATEGTALPNTTAAATFTDTDSSDTASSFTATINWGDGVTTNGTVVGSAGSFTVEGGHTYADEGSDPASVTLTHTADNLQATASGTVAVAEGDSFTPHGTTITVAPNHAFSGAVATFSDIDTANVGSDFSATINWGDGTTTAGTITGSSGAFTVDGSHTYATAGQFTITVTGADDSPGTATFTTTSTAKVVGFPGQMVLTAATEDKKLPNSTAVATFTDSTPGDTAGSFTATINWGDGVTTAGTVVGSHGTFTVEGGHTYADEGSDAASVTLTRKSDHLQSTVSGTVVVADDDVFTPHGIISVALPTFSGTIATFSDTDTSNGAGDFAASINWGDGTTTTGTVTGSHGAFSVNGSHTYTQTALETVKVTLTDDAPGTATATATSFIVAADPPFGSHASAAGSPAAKPVPSVDSTLALLVNYMASTIPPSGLAHTGAPFAGQLIPSAQNPLAAPSPGGHPQHT